MKLLPSIAALLLLTSSPVFAEGTWLSGFSSHHSKNGAELNTNNYGQGYRSASGYAVVAYRNSYDRDSLFVGRELRTTGPLAVGLIVGAVTGYPMWAVAPVVLPEVVVSTRQVELAVVYMPAPTKAYVSAVAVQVRYRLTGV